MSLDDRVVVVTGGAQGIGRGIALRLAAAGGRIAIFDAQLRNQGVQPVRIRHGVSERRQNVGHLGCKTIEQCLAHGSSAALIGV